MTINQRTVQPTNPLLNQSPNLSSMLMLQWVGYITIVRKELIRVLRIWPQTLLPSVMTTTLYFVIFGRFIGDRIGVIEGFSYIQFIIPGLIMMSVITNSYTNVSSSVFGAKFGRSIEELLVSPLSNTTVLLGYVSGGVLRSVMVGILVILVAMFFSPMTIQSPLLVGVTMVMTALVFAFGGFINAMLARKFDEISIMPTFVLTPLTYLGGVFYSISFLPEMWQIVSLLNPILYLVNIFRYGFLGVSDVPIWGAFVFLAVFLAGLWFICLHLLKRGVGLRA